MSGTAPMPSTWATAYLCCRECRQFRLFCSNCGAEHTMQLQVVKPFPADFTFTCDHCEGGITVRLMGLRPNPTMELPAAEVLSDALPGLERSWAKPAGRRTRPHQPRQLQRQQPCPPGAERHRLAHWVALGLVAASIPPASIAASYRRVFGAEPRKQRQTLIYSRREVLSALEGLGALA